MRRTMVANQQQMLRSRRRLTLLVRTAWALLATGSLVSVHCIAWLNRGIVGSCLVIVGLELGG